jgi:hypothetical protein
VTGYLEIPTVLLPRPRVIIWHGDIETDAEARALDIVGRTVAATMDHGHGITGRLAGGNDWSGWHLNNRIAVGWLGEIIGGLAEQFPHWHVIIEVTP